MNRAEELKKEILSEIKKPVIPDSFHMMSGKINGETVQAALDEFKSVEIPFIGDDIVISKPIIMSSDCHLKVAQNQVIRQKEGGELCLLRNKNIQDGAFGMTDPKKRDKNISVSGGIWHIRKAQRCNIDAENKAQGALGAVIFCGVEEICLKDMVIYDSPLCGEAGKTSSSYGIQICDCESFTVENIDFKSNHRDGVHVNGPAKYGHIKHIRGEEMGDDMVAVNAWDWDTSAITFGTISNVVIEDVKGQGNPFRLLPGQKLYENGEKADCDIENIVIRDISGVYNFKLYAQPNIANAKKKKHDVSGTVGNIRNVYFNDISFLKISREGLCKLAIKALFEICADLDGLYIDGVDIGNTYEQYAEKGVCFMNVGPLSAVLTNGSDDPTKWGEIFDPDAVCHADNIYLKDIRFADEVIKNKELLTREVKMTVNPDYPKTTPRGGTGYGTIGKVILEN